LLFLLYINDIQNCVPNATFKLFADDTNLFVHGKTLLEVFDKANNSIILLYDWFCANRLSLSVEKSCYSVFGGDVSAASAYTISQRRIQGRFVGFGRTSLGSDEPPPPSGRVWWLKTLELHGCIKVVQLEIFSLRLYRSCTQPDMATRTHRIVVFARLRMSSWFR